MKIVVAPTSFKGTLGVIDASIAIIRGIRQIDARADIVQFPVSDGGDGFLEAALFNCGGKYVDTVVTGPRGKKQTVVCGVLSGGSGIVEMAKASGFALLEETERNPLLTSSYGTGELILSLIKRGVRKVIVGVGGSATIDVGMGCMQALGVKFLDGNGKEVEFMGREIAAVKGIDISMVPEEVRQARIIVAADVNNVLLGDEGAVFTYGKQKGLKDEDAPFMEDAVHHFAEVIKSDFNRDVTTMKGGGAAGGIGAGLYGVLGAELKDGTELFFKLAKFTEKVKGSEAIITGEGSFDSLTGYGKAVQRVLAAGREEGIIVIVLAGKIAESAEKQFSDGRSFGISITPPGMDFKKAKECVGELLQKGTVEAMQELKRLVRG